jgi:hypothetical protein
VTERRHGRFTRDVLTSSISTLPLSPTKHPRRPLGQGLEDPLTPTLCLNFSHDSAFPREARQTHRLRSLNQGPALRPKRSSDGVAEGGGRARPGRRYGQPRREKHGLALAGRHCAAPLLRTKPPDRHRHGGTAPPIARQPPLPPRRGWDHWGHWAPVDSKSTASIKPKERTCTSRASCMPWPKPSPSPGPRPVPVSLCDFLLSPGTHPSLESAASPGKPTVLPQQHQLARLLLLRGSKPHCPSGSIVLGIVSGTSRLPSPRPLSESPPHTFHLPSES